MFKVEHNVPEIYCSESRDFQLFARLYDLVFQASRFSIDSMKNISSTKYCNERALRLIATKVGFFSNYNISDDAYRHILSAFPYIIKHKGSLRGVELIINVFQKICNTSISVSSESNLLQELTIEFTDYAREITLLQELLEYVRPTGYIINYVIKSNISTTDKIVHTDKVKVTKKSPITTYISSSYTIDYSSEIGHSQVVNFANDESLVIIGENNDAS